MPEKETVAQVEDNVRNMIDAMGLSKVKQDDKAHRLGKIKEINGKKHQGVIVRFKWHSARYEVFNKRKALRNTRISPNLTKIRSKMLNDAIELTKVIEKNDWGFVYANMHGDLMIRLSEKFKGRHYYSFDSIKSLTDKLVEFGLMSQQ